MPHAAQHSLSAAAPPGVLQCFGPQNREAPLRLCSTPGNPAAANCELKTSDGTANPHLAAAALIGGCWGGGWVQHVGRETGGFGVHGKQQFVRVVPHWVPARLLCMPPAQPMRDSPATLHAAVDSQLFSIAPLLCSGGAAGCAAAAAPAARLWPGPWHPHRGAAVRSRHRPPARQPWRGHRSL